MKTFKLAKPVMIDGIEKKEIEFDLEELKGSSVQEAIKVLTKKGHTVVVQETDPMLHAVIFAIAAGIDIEDVMRFSAKDFMKAGLEVRNFFFIDSGDSQEASS